MSYKSFDRKVRGLPPFEEEEKQKSVWDDSATIQKDEIVLDDGEVLDAELWTESGITYLTYTIESKGFEDAAKEDILDYMNQQGMEIRNESYKMFDMLKRHGKIVMTMKIGEM